MTPMTCKRGVALLMDYLEGEIPGPVRRAIDSHVAGCTRCRAFVASYRATPGILRHATARVPARDERRRLLATLRSRLQAGRRRS